MKIKTILCQCFALLMFTMGLRTVSAQDVAVGVPRFTLAVIIPSGPYKLGDNIRLHVRLTNITDQIVYIPVPPGVEWGDRVYRFELVDSSGKPVLKWSDLVTPKKVAPETLGTGSSQSKAVQPAGTLEQDVSLERKYKITEAGRYTLRVSLRDSLAKVLVVSDPVVVEIVPAS